MEVTASLAAPEAIRGKVVTIVISNIMGVSVSETLQSTLLIMNGGSVLTILNTAEEIKTKLEEYYGQLRPVKS